MTSANLHLEILSRRILKDVPSASGIAKFKDDFFLIGDDSPFLFRLDKEFNTLSKTLIYPTEKAYTTTIPKIEKADFEAMEMVSDTQILIFASGSKSPQRDVCVLVDIREDITSQIFDISTLYAYFKNLEIMQGFELNIEGLAFKDDFLYLFNRGRNAIFSFPLKEFLAYCTTGSQFPVPQSQLFSLPKINTIEAGFSGATNLKDSNYFIFTAAVEDTLNAYDDGAILGSFMGILQLNNGTFAEKIFIKEIESSTSPLKVEAVIVDEILSEKTFDLVLVTDNDGFPSEIIRMRMKIS